jgi:hypothetical protein
MILAFCVDGIPAVSISISSLGSEILQEVI